MKKGTMTMPIVIAIVAVAVLIMVSSPSGFAAKGGQGGKGGGKGGPKAQCSDGLDNDGDGFCDFAWKKAKCRDGALIGDNGCLSKDDNDESNCGDGVCEGVESCSSCAPDCGLCEYCGDGTCNAGETCNTCSNDCGTCPTPNSCTDTDGGFNPGTQGTVSGITNEIPFSNTDTCTNQSTTVLEWYCSGDQPVYGFLQCTNSTCVNGACV